MLLLTRTTSLGHLSHVTIAEITSVVRDVPSQVSLTTADGLPRDCAVNLHHIQTVSQSLLGPLITTLSEARMDAVRKAALFALDLGP